MVIGWLAMLVFTFHACTHMVAAGDTWVAMACGRHFVNHGVDTVEPFSANSHKAGPRKEEVATWPGWARWITDKVGLETVKKWHPTGWINQNWLTHVIFYKLTTALGSEDEPYFDALVFWKFAVYLLATLCLYLTCRTLGVDPALAAVSCCLAMFVGRSFFDIRPAGFSNLLAAAYLLVLALTSYRNPRYIWLLVPLIVFWANVHGGYIYAFIMLVPFVGWHLLMHQPKRWIIAVYSILTWSVLCVMAHRFLNHEWLQAVPFYRDWVLYVGLVAIAASIAMTLNKRISYGVLTALHGIISGILFLVLFARYLPAIPSELNMVGRKMLEDYAAGARLVHLGISFFALTLSVVVLALRDRVVHTMAMKGTLHTVAAGATAFVAMVIFNPFHLTNLTHTFVISVSKHAERWRDVHEWHRAFDWSNPVGTAIPFLVMYILAWLCLLIWVVAFIRTARIVDRAALDRKEARTVADFVWPRLDLALLGIAGMTIFMAIKSRRFIPIAAFAACPLIALFLQQAVRNAAAILSHRRGGRLEVPAVPVALRRTCIIAGAVVVLTLGTIWGLKFKRVYLDYWPSDARRHSIFMRMTASDAKPFEACRFIRDNELTGNMFNYWTEGGFIAWGQQPDRDTGRTPLKLFMDGRAQAAYDRAAFDHWTEIMSGGPVRKRAVLARRDLAAQEYAEMGQWVTDELQKHKVWVTLMPSNQFNTPLSRALDGSPDWRVVFLDGRQKLLVNIKTARGKKLYDGMFTGKVVYPDEFRADLAMGHNLLLFRSKSRRRAGLDLIIRGFRRDPSPVLMQTLLLSARYSPELKPRVNQVCMEYAAEFEKNKAQYAEKDGYHLRLEAARLATIRLREVAEAEGNTELAEVLAGREARYLNERDSAAVEKQW